MILNLVFWSLLGFTVLALSYPSIAENKTVIAFCALLHREHRGRP